MTHPTILTIILNYRTPELTLRATEAALREMQDLLGEVVIVDNCSGDGSFETLTHAAQTRGWLDGARLRVIQSPRNGGFGAGMNFGMAAGLSDGSQPDYYYLLNSDAFPEPQAIQHLRDFLTNTPKAGMVGSYVRGVDGTPHATAFRFPSIAGEFESAARTGVISRLLKASIVALPIPTSELQVDWTAGASLMIRRQMIESIGNFDETFFLYFEETDLCRRAARAGWHTHYLPVSEVQHVGSASTGMNDWARVPSYWLDSRQHYFCKNHGRLYAAAATLALWAGGMIWQLRRLISNKPRRDPPRFLRDLIIHALRRALPVARRAPRDPHLTDVLPEDLK
ncbi:glycosyltransferase family 2 protein (plasmid) [Parasedimentitalea marina]|uniref:Glycosyltransferase family 2 protein n=1 Tax=Parasedimentitalea marina TaxID=2483033 RepID=A0A3T0NA33_9RHOB|nr:glycosyltransferase family 2 protein [Parasedimentitalea marina]AZV80914.1 glycosyltransferase family 2 protein [Parasedimentitalea marina]